MILRTVFPLLFFTKFSISKGGPPSVNFTGPSAIDANLCKTLYGEGDPAWVTKSGICDTETAINLYCSENKSPIQQVGAPLACPKGYTCIDHHNESDTAIPDAGCYLIPPIDGKKPVGNDGSVACSPGYNVAGYDMWITTWITGPAELQSCWVKSTVGDVRVFNQYPCHEGHASVLLKANTAYQSCTSWAPGLGGKEFTWTWHFKSAVESEIPDREA